MRRPTPSSSPCPAGEKGDPSLGSNARHPDSVWAATAAAAPEAPPLEGEHTADVAIIGAGYTGLSAALHLAESGSDVVVLEGAEIGFGGSGRNAGLVNAGIWLAPDDIEELMGAQAGARLNEALGSSPDLVFSTIERHGIDCEAVRNGTLHMAHSPTALEDLERRCDQWARRGAPVEIVDRQTVAEMTGSELYFGALFDRRAGTIQPLSYVRGLALAACRAGAAIHERSPARAITRDGDRWRVATPAGSVRTEAVIVATNAYSDDLWPGLEQTLFTAEYFQFATEPLTENLRRSILPGGQGAWDTRAVMSNMRLTGEGGLILGSLGRLPNPHRSFLRTWADRMLARMFPHLGPQRWAFGWAGSIGFTPDRLPRLHELAPGVLACLGYNGRGIGPGAVMGKALAERLSGSPEEELPLQITAMRPVPLRGLRAGAYELGFRAFHVKQVWLGS